MKVWDLHCDTLSELRRAEKTAHPKALPTMICISTWKNCRPETTCCNVWPRCESGRPAPGADPLVSVLEEIDIFKRLMAAYPERIAPVYTAADLERNHAEASSAPC